MVKVLVILVALSVVCFGVGAQDRHSRRRVQYEHFEDYLVSVTAHREENQVLKPEDAVEAGEQGASTPAPTPTSTTPAPQHSASQILAYFRDVPRHQWSCCMLGMLAGNKGFHCHTGFYAARVQMRNYNRAHSRRMPLHTAEGAASRWGLDIMRTFQRCIVQSSSEFHKCCYAATIEQRELNRWAAIRNGSMPVTSGEERHHHRNRD